MYKDAIDTQDAYAFNQYNACCRYLDISASFDAEGKTLLEKIVQLTEQRDRLAEAFQDMLNDTPTPTPRTDEASCNSKTFDSPMAAIDFARTLERELTAVTEQRDRLENCLNLESSRILNLTVQRDRLQKIVDEQCRVSSVCREMRLQRDRMAEALQKAKAVYTPSSGGEYQTGWHDAICWVNQQALQSLNQPEQ